MDKYRTAIIIPSYNEEKTIVNVVNLVKDFGEVILIDDGSTDSTEELISKSNITYIKNNRNLGYDKSLTIGLHWAIKKRFDFAITFDADGQHPHSSIDEILKLLKKDTVIVCGVRDKFQRISEYIFSIFTFLIWGIKDPLCGLKGYSLNKIKISDSFSFHPTIGTKLLINACKSKKTISQIKLKTQKRLDSPRFGVSYKGELKILKALIHSFFSL